LAITTLHTQKHTGQAAHSHGLSFAFFNFVPSIAVALPVQSRAAL